MYSVNRENSKATRFRVIVNMVVFLLYKNIEVVIQQEKMEVWLSLPMENRVINDHHWKVKTERKTEGLLIVRMRRLERLHFSRRRP